MFPADPPDERFLLHLPVTWLVCSWLLSRGLISAAELQTGPDDRIKPERCVFLRSDFMEDEGQSVVLRCAGVSLTLSDCSWMSADVTISDQGH